MKKYANINLITSITVAIILLGVLLMGSTMMDMFNEISAPVEDTLFDILGGELEGDPGAGWLVIFLLPLYLIIIMIEAVIIIVGMAIPIVVSVITLILAIIARAIFANKKGRIIAYRVLTSIEYFILMLSVLIWLYIRVALMGDVSILVNIPEMAVLTYIVSVIMLGLINSYKYIRYTPAIQHIPEQNQPKMQTQQNQSALVTPQHADLVSIEALPAQNTFIHPNEKAKKYVNFNLYTLMVIVAAMVIMIPLIRVLPNAYSEEKSSYEEAMEEYGDNEEISDVEGYGIIISALDSGLTAVGSFVIKSLLLIVSGAGALLISIPIIIARLIYKDNKARVIAYRVIMTIAYVITGIATLIWSLLIFLTLTGELIPALVVVILGYMITMIVLGIRNTYFKIAYNK